MVSNTSANRLYELQNQIDALIAQYTQPYERRIGYGNLRREYSEWGDGEEKITNIAIIFETPGGSTAQINVTYDHGRDVFCPTQTANDEPYETQSVEEIMEFIRAQVQQIPQKRRESLKRQVEIWNEEGMSRGEIFSQMNKLLQLEFVGGRITNAELRDAINYAIKLRGGPAPEE